MADNGLGGSIDHRDRVLAAVGHEDPFAIWRANNVPWLSSGREGPNHAGAEGTPGGIADLDNGDGAARSIGHVGVLAIGRQGDALRLITDAEFCDPRIIIRADHTDRVIRWIDDPNEFIVGRYGNRARVSSTAINLR